MHRFLFVWNLPVTDSETTLLALPKILLAKHVYWPSSDCVTSRISKLPSSQMNTLGHKRNSFLMHHIKASGEISKVRSQVRTCGS